MDNMSGLLPPFGNAVLVILLMVVKMLLVENTSKHGAMDDFR